MAKFIKPLGFKKGQALVEYVIILGLFAVILMMATYHALNHGFGKAFDKYKQVLAGPYKY